MYAGDSHPLRLTTTSRIDRAIGGRVRAERWRRQWSCERLAHAARMSPMQLRFAEWGWARLSAQHMLHVLHALDRNPAWLFEGLFPGED